MANGRAASIEVNHALSRASYLVIADVAGKAGNLRILAAAQLDERVIRTTLSDKITSQILVDFDSDNSRVRGLMRKYYGAIELECHPMPNLKGHEANCAWIEAVHRHGTGILPWSKAASSLRKRLEWLFRLFAAPWPDVSEHALQRHPENWLQDFLPGLARLPNLAQLNEAELKKTGDFLFAALLAQVPYAQQRQIDYLAPCYFTAPTGTQVPINYEADTPSLSVRVQELFGLDCHPSIANGRIKLVVELLSPANRPIQITRDLPTFWRGSWADVRADMRGRYPKHFWPQEPLKATPTRHAKPRIP